MVKPSEFTPNITALLTELIPQYLDPDMYAIVNGAIPETKAVSVLAYAGRQTPSRRACSTRVLSATGVVELLFS